MEVIATGIGTMEDLKWVEKLEVTLTGKGPMEDFEGCI